MEKEAYQNSQSEHQDHHSDVNSRIKTMILNKQNKDQELQHQYHQQQDQQQALQHQHEQQMQQDQQMHQEQQQERQQQLEQQEQQQQQIQMHQEQMQHLMQQQQQQGIGRSSPLLTQQQIRENSRILSPISEQQTPIQQQIHIQQISDQQQHEQFYGMSNDFSKVNASSNLSGMNFLVQGHHPQNLVTEGGGAWDWGSSQSYLPETGGMSAMESFMKYAASMDEKAGLHDINNLPGMRTFLSTSSFQPSYNYKLPSRPSNPSSWLDPVQNLKHKNLLDYGHKSLSERKSYPSDNRWMSHHEQKRLGYPSSPSTPLYYESKKSYLGHDRLFPHSKRDSHLWSDKYLEPKPRYNDPLWTSRDYPPFANPSMYWANKLNSTAEPDLHLKHQPRSKIIIEDRRPHHLVPLLLKQKDLKVPFGVDPRMDELSDLNKSYVFAGEGGPCELNDCSGPWCCRRGGTETPTPEHMKDGLCQGMRTQDEMTEPKEMNNNDEPATVKPEDLSSKEMMDHIER